MDLTGNSAVMEEILTAVTILSRQPQPGASGYRVLEAECSFRIGLPNSTTMTVDVAHSRAPPGCDTDTTVDVVIPCTDHGCFVRLWPELKAHDKESHTGTVVHVRKGSMLVMPGTMIRGFGISGSTNGNPLLQLSVRVGQAPLLGSDDDGSRTASAGTDLRGVGFLQPQKWWYFLPVGESPRKMAHPARLSRFFRN